MSGWATVPPFWIVTRTPTIGDGIVYRWFSSVRAAENGYPSVSASRNAVEVDATARDQPECDDLLAAIAAAWEVKQDLADMRDPQHLVTHQRGGVFSGPLVPVGPVDA